MGKKFTDDIPAGIRIKAAALPPICAVFTGMAEHGAETARQIDPEVPDVGNRLWVAFLTHVDATARDCVELQHATTADQLIASAKAIHTDGNAAAPAARMVTSRLSIQH